MSAAPTVVRHARTRALTESAIRVAHRHRVPMHGSSFCQTRPAAEHRTLRERDGRMEGRRKGFTRARARTHTHTHTHNGASVIQAKRREGGRG